MRDYGLLFVAVLAFGALAATFGGLAAIAGRESAARRAGYAAAVDSVRACERYPFLDARNAFGDRFDVTVYDAADSVTAVIHFGRLPK